MLSHFPGELVQLASGIVDLARTQQTHVRPWCPAMNDLWLQAIDYQPGTVALIVLRFQEPAPVGGHAPGVEPFRC